MGPLSIYPTLGRLGGQICIISVLCAYDDVRLFSGLATPLNIEALLLKGCFLLIV